MPLDSDDILNDFNDDDPAWMIRDAISGARLNIPDKQYPGTEVVRLFLSEVDAKTVIEKTKAAGSTRIGNSVLVAVPVPLLMTIREIVDLRRRARTSVLSSIRPTKSTSSSDGRPRTTGAHTLGNSSTYG